MNKKIFRSAAAVAILVFLATVTLIMGILFQHFEGQLQAELKNEADYIAHSLRSEGASFFDSFDFKDRRVTLIASDGTVLLDTTADVTAMDNHKNRDEVRQALESGSGVSTRFSDTIMQKTVYYAVRLDDGNILRVSSLQYSIVAILISLVQPMIIVFIIALLLAFFLSSRVSKSIIKPINALDLENPENNIAYEELYPLLSKISAQRRTIDKQLKDAQQKQEEFRLITENMNEGFLVIDNNAFVLTYNTAAKQLLDIPDMEKGSVLTLNRTKGFRQLVEKVLSGQYAESELAYDSRCYNLIANPVFEGGKTIGGVIVILDVTEIVKREQLRREFTSNVSHELKTPLTSISGFAEMMKAGGTSDETVVDFSTSIYDEAQRLITLVNDIIKISEIDEKHSEFEKETVDLYSLSQEIIRRLSPVAENLGIKFNLIGESTSIYGVRKILDEIIYNLCDNAIKYNKENGVVDVILTSSEAHTKLTVRDTGIGIPQSELNRIFERFYRVDKSHSKAIGGTGLGLSIVKHGALYHKAQINIDSTEGEGTSISITFNKN